MSSERPPVLTKADMYPRLVAGEFGNTLPRFFTIREWRGSGAAGRYRLWGVQHTTLPGFPGTRLNVESEKVEALIAEKGFGRNYVISPMIHQVGHVQWEGDCYDHPERGLLCSGHFNPDPGSWRTHMKNPYLWEGTRAMLLLRLVLNPNSFDDLMELLPHYPEHVFEFSALDCCFGTREGRNSIVWECRKY